MPLCQSLGSCVGDSVVLDDRQIMRLRSLPRGYCPVVDAVAMPLVGASRWLGVSPLESNIECFTNFRSDSIVIRADREIELHGPAGSVVRVPENTYVRFTVADVSQPACVCCFPQLIEERQGAIFSPCRTWRYWLWRIWDPGKPLLAWVGLNPSTADETKNDPTVERCERRTRSDGLYGGMLMLNLFGYRSTAPKGLLEQEDPVGPSNDAALRAGVAYAAATVAAWGSHGDFRGRSGRVLQILRESSDSLLHLGLTKSGQPRHPLYVPYVVRPCELPVEP